MADEQQGQDSVLPLSFVAPFASRKYAKGYLRFWSNQAIALPHASCAASVR